MKKIEGAGMLPFLTFLGFAIWQLEIGPMLLAHFKVGLLLSVWGYLDDWPVSQSVSERLTARSAFTLDPGQSVDEKFKTGSAFSQALLFHKEQCKIYN